MKQLLAEIAKARSTVGRLNRGENVSEDGSG